MPGAVEAGPAIQAATPPGISPDAWRRLAPWRASLESGSRDSMNRDGASPTPASLPRCNARPAKRTNRDAAAPVMRLAGSVGEYGRTPLDRQATILRRSRAHIDANALVPKDGTVAVYVPRPKRTPPKWRDRRPLELVAPPAVRSVIRRDGCAGTTQSTEPGQSFRSRIASLRLSAGAEPVACRGHRGKLCCATVHSEHDAQSTLTLMLTLEVRQATGLPESWPSDSVIRAHSGRSPFRRPSRRPQRPSPHNQLPTGELHRRGDAGRRDSPLDSR